MADIKKRLVISAELKKGDLKRQIDELKKELSDVSIGGGADLSAFNKSVSGLKEAAEELKKALAGMKQVSGINGSSKSGGGRRSRGTEDVSEKERRTAWEDHDKQVAADLRQRQREEQKLSNIARKENEKSWEDHDKQVAQSLKQKQQQEIKSQKETAKQQEILRKQSHNEALKQAKQEQDVKARFVNQIKGQVGSLFGARPGMIGTMEGMSGLSSMGKMGIKGLGIAGAALGVAGAGGQAYSTVRELQVAQSMREQAFGLDLLSGQGLSGAVGESGRTSFGAGLAGAAKGGASGGIKGMLAGAALGGGVGLMAGGIGAIPGALIGGAAGLIGGAGIGGAQGFYQETEEEAKRRQQQTELANQSLQKAKAVRDARISVLRGGGITSDQLTGLQGQAANLGLSAEETMQQAQQAKPFLGNRNLGGTLTQMQRMFQQTGMGVGEQAQAAETMAGATRGKMSPAQALMQQERMLQRAVTLGLDQSKSGQFLKTTADYVSQSTGLGQLDIGSIENRILEAARGFAGGGEITATNLQQAQQLQQMLKTESTATGGISGLGNIMAVQEALGTQATPDKFLAAMKISRDATVDDVQDILGVDKETAQRFKDLRQKGAFEMGAQGMGLEGPLKTALGASERNITAEQQRGAERALGTQAFVGPSVALESIQEAPEVRARAAEQQVQQTAFVQGMNLMRSEAEVTAKSLETFKERLNESIKSLEKFTGINTRVMTTGGGN